MILKNTGEYSRLSIAQFIEKLEGQDLEQQKIARMNNSSGQQYIKMYYKVSQQQLQQQPSSSNANQIEDGKKKAYLVNQYDERVPEDDEKSQDGESVSSENSLEKRQVFDQSSTDSSDDEEEINQINIDKLEKRKEKRAAKDQKKVKCKNVAQEEKSEQSEEVKVAEKTRNPKSGVSEVPIIKNALKEYCKTCRHKSFPHLASWEVARHHPKWVPVTLVDMDGPTAPKKRGGSKRLKTSESGNYTTSESSNMPEMNLNDQPDDEPERDDTPTRPHRKKSGDSSSRGKKAVADSITEFKAARLAEMAEAKERKEKLAASKLKHDDAYIKHLTKTKKNEIGLTYIFATKKFVQNKLVENQEIRSN
ncbi:corepressor interacting with RBPJ 1-like [Helianthus annuus]|uniref:corepressor interacting with RBPJ 1-like n=1 Tax=Helianthus annuus TaxID=4232 RepID=UPI0016530D9B|nr:corepressor interacting with RBPJ 1-like [Helianthus annuus]